MKKDSPVLKQFRNLKEKHPDALLLFRKGDVIKFYNEDAEKAGGILGLAVSQAASQTANEKGFEKVAAFPFYSLDSYLPKLIQAGQRVAICDQLEPTKKKEMSEPQKEMAEAETPKVAGISESQQSSMKAPSSKKGNGESAMDKTLDLFADMMIEKINSISQDWRKPWFTEGAMAWPKNLNGREYNGMNALMLMMHQEKEGYKLPIYATFNAIAAMNVTKDKEGKSRPASDKEGNELPTVSVKKGEKSFPVMLTTFTVVDKETKDKIPYDDYKRLSEAEKQKYNVFPKLHVFRVFNVEQTTLQEARPELWKTLEEKNTVKKPESSEKMLSFAPVDKMIQDNLWICPIKPTYGDNAYYSISKNEIVVPEKRQFKNGESFYSNLFHEMGHSTGAENQLGRLKTAAFGSAEYAREELVAELTAALTAQRYGMQKNLKSDSAAYLKSWLNSLKEEPDFIKTTLVDVKKATALITQSIDGVAERLETERSVEEQKGKITKDMDEKMENIANVENSAQFDTHEKEGQPMYYSSVAFLQMDVDTQHFDTLKDMGDYKTILQEAEKYDQGEALDLQETFKSPTQYRGDDVLNENDRYAVVYNSSVGGTYSIMRKVSEGEVKRNIERYGISPHASQDVKDLAKQMEAEKDSHVAKEIPVAQEQKKEIPQKDTEKDVNHQDLVEQFNKLKNIHPDAVLLFRTGDFYNLYNHDAVLGAKILGITANMDDSVKRKGFSALASFPHHALDTYLPKLIRAGQRVAICDNLEPVKKKVKKEEHNINPKTSPIMEKQKGQKQSSKEEKTVKAKTPRKPKQEATDEKQKTQTRKSEKIAPEEEKTSVSQTPTEVKQEEKKPTQEKNEKPQAEKVEQQEEKVEKKKREPQLITVNGDKVSHAHAFQHNENPDVWLFTAKLNDKQLHPMVMTERDVAAYQSNGIIVKELMEHYYPAKMTQRLSPEEFKAGTQLSNGQNVEKFRVYKEANQEHDGFGKWKGYAEVDGQKMVAVLSPENLNAYFDRIKTPAQIVEHTFGEKLHLASAYENYKLPEGIQETDVRINKDKDGKWKVSVDLGDMGVTPKKELSFDDGQSYFKAKTATRGQLAAKYLTPDLHSMLSQKQELQQGMKR